MSMIKIDKGIPMPEPKRNRGYPWKELEVGDSFLIPGKSGQQGSSSASFRLHPKTFAARRDGDGWRIWRTA